MPTSVQAEAARSGVVARRKRASRLPVERASATAPHPVGRRHPSRRRREPVQQPEKSAMLDLTNPSCRPSGECKPASAWIKADRLHPLIPRETPRFTASYRRRAAVEREFGRLKNEWSLTPLRVRGVDRGGCITDLTDPDEARLRAQPSTRRTTRRVAISGDRRVGGCAGTLKSLRRSPTAWS